MPLRLVFGIVLVALLTGCTPLPAQDPELAAVAYQDGIESALGGVGDALTGIIEAAQAPQLDDAQWRDALLVDLAAIRTAQTNLTALKPPAALATQHAKLVSAYGLCVNAVDKMEPGITAGKLDYAALYGAGALMQQCATDLAPPLTEIKTYIAQFE